jgi:hypothetical protein
MFLEPYLRHCFARKLLLATDWMVSSGQKQGLDVIDRYKLACELGSKWGKAYLHLAEYLDTVATSMKDEYEKNGLENAQARIDRAY